jgi:hypothetical protein
MDLESNYEIARTAEFIHSRNFTRVALQVTETQKEKKTKKETSYKPWKNLSCLNRPFGFQENEKESVESFVLTK